MSKRIQRMGFETRQKIDEFLEYYDCNVYDIYPENDEWILEYYL